MSMLFFRLESSDFCPDGKDVVAKGCDSLIQLPRRKERGTRVEDEMDI